MSNILKKTFKYLNGLAVTIGLAASLTAGASQRYETYEVFVSPSGASWDIPAGNNARFEIRVLRNNIPLDKGEVDYEVSEDMMPARLTGKVRIKDGVAHVDGGMMKSPEFIRCKAVFHADGFHFR